MRGGRDLHRYEENAIPRSVFNQGVHTQKTEAFENRFKHSLQSKADPYHAFTLPLTNIHPRPRGDSEHISFLAGVRIIKPDKSPHKYSGYQVVRLATELIPAYSALLGNYKIIFSIICNA